jgi:phosphonate transport system permease protein
VVTVCIALRGTTLAVAVSIPLGLLGARNLSPHPLIYFAARRTMDVLRAVNEFVFALMFVTAVGLGPFAGMLALGVHTGGVLRQAPVRDHRVGRPRPGRGGGRGGRHPLGVRHRNGGGWGHWLLPLGDTIRSFRDGEAATVILLIVAMVMGIDMVSARVRQAAI